MSIINCVECNNKISDKAQICPHCGYKQGNTEIYIKNPRVGKKKIVIGKIMTAFGLIYAFIGTGANDNSMATIGVLLFVIGIIVLSVGKFQHWWNWR